MRAQRKMVSGCNLITSQLMLICQGGSAKFSGFFIFSHSTSVLEINSLSCAHSYLGAVQSGHPNCDLTVGVSGLH